MTSEQKRWFRVGYKAAVSDALDRCQCERIEITGPGDKEYNMAIIHCIAALRPMKARPAIDVYEAVIEKARADG